MQGSASGASGLFWAQPQPGADDHSPSHPDLSCQGQLELLRLLFTEALYDEYLSRVSGSAPSLLPPELPVAFKELQSEMFLQAAWAQFLCPLPLAVVHSRRLSIPLCPRGDQWPRHRNQVMRLCGCSLQGSGDEECEWLSLRDGDGEANLKTSSWLCPTLSHPSARQWLLRATWDPPCKVPACADSTVGLEKCSAVSDSTVGL